MKNFTFLKPVFSQGMLIFLVLIALANFFSFSYLQGKEVLYFILIQEAQIIVAYAITRMVDKDDKVIWPFAKKWWPEESKTP